MPPTTAIENLRTLVKSENIILLHIHILSYTGREKESEKFTEIILYSKNEVENVHLETIKKIVHSFVIMKK